jgi:hypothetical protein
MDFINIKSIDDLLKKAFGENVQDFDESWIDTGTGQGKQTFKEKKPMLGDQTSDSMSDEESQMGSDDYSNKSDVLNTDDIINPQKWTQKWTS